MSAVAAEQSPATGLAIRRGCADDLPFVISSWKQNYWRESPWAHRLRWPVFNKGHDPVVRALLERSSVLVACDTASTDEIAGYLVFEAYSEWSPEHPANTPALHFAYVKPAFRRAGVFSSLLKATGLPADLAGVEVTHCTRAWFSMPPVRSPVGVDLRPGRTGLESHYPGAVHNPYRWVGLHRPASATKE